MSVVILFAVSRIIVVASMSYVDDATQTTTSELDLGHQDLLLS
jgi:hypothetical protein